MFSSALGKSHGVVLLSSITVWLLLSVTFKSVTLDGLSSGNPMMILCSITFVRDIVCASHGSELLLVSEFLLCYVAEVSIDRLVEIPVNTWFVRLIFLVSEFLHNLSPGSWIEFVHLLDELVV